MQMPHVWLEGPRCYAHQYLEHGFVYITCGNRGSESRDSEGKLCGKSPANLVDLKTAIRFLRHNREFIPGDFNRIISVGWSAGGAMSTLLGVTGNNKNFTPYLEENGAFMEERDDVFACQIYCPIIDLEHADLAYEWMFCADPENESSPAGPAGVMTPFQAALSEKLKEKYIEYFNSLRLEDPVDHSPIRIGKDGRSGSGYDYLMRKLDESATVWLGMLSGGDLPLDYSVEDYLEGNYEYEAKAPRQNRGNDDREKETDLMQGHAGPGVALWGGPGSGEEKGKAAEPLTLGDMVSRPPKGEERKMAAHPVIRVKGKDKTGWLSWDGTHAHIRDLDSYVLNHRRRMKPCTSFDTLGKNSGENRVFGSPERHYMHFNGAVAEAIGQLKEQFGKEWEQYYESFREDVGDKELEKRIWLINPLSYIGTGKRVIAPSITAFAWEPATGIRLCLSA